VIEDDDDYGERMLRHLKSAGARGFRAATFLDALKMLRTRPEFDGILSDVMIPRKKGKEELVPGGIEFVKKIKQENDNIPIFVYSSNFSPEELEKLQSEGVCEKYASRDALDSDEGQSRQNFVDELLENAKSFKTRREEIGAAYRQELAEANLELLRHQVDDNITDEIDEHLKIEVLQSDDFEGIYPNDELIDTMLRRPIPIWIVKRGNELFTAEVYRANSIRAFGNSEQEARSNLARVLKQAIISMMDPARAPHHVSGLKADGMEFLKPYIRTAAHG